MTPHRALRWAALAASMTMLASPWRLCTAVAQDVPAGPSQGAEAMPPGHPSVAPVGPSTGPERDPFDAPPVATSQAAHDLPAGTVRVTVIDVDGHPIDGATVLLGTMAQGGDRVRVSATTREGGRHVWTDLATGQGQAYRVSVPFEGAVYACTPFQLPSDHGYDVRVVRLPVTHDDRIVLQVIGQTFVELRNERLHVTQQAQLANTSRTAETYVFPEDGLRVQLPAGHLAFQAQPVMTDQRVEELAGQGFRIRGSLPPGRVSLTWGFDLPVHGSSLDAVLPVPFRTYIYRVISEAPPGMTLEFDGMPTPERFEDEGRPLFGSELMRRPGDEPFPQVGLRFRGIPGPGPARWIALVMAGLVVLAGAYATMFGGSAQHVAERSRQRRKQELLDEAAALESDHRRGEIGPVYRQSRHDAIVRELAVLLHQEQGSITNGEAAASAAASVSAGVST